MDKLYILDAVNLLFRAYHAIGPGMTNGEGASTGALYGFIRSYFKLLRELQPTHLVAVFDGPNNSQKRKELYSDYKKHRAGMPEDLAIQLQWTIKFCGLAQIPYLQLPGVEADDVIASLTKKAEKKGTTVYICSSDKDLCQLVSPHVFIINPHKDHLLMDTEKVKEMFGVFPKQIVDWIALIGDASDHIPGIAGIGPKTAVSLLEEFGSLEGIYQHLSHISGRKKELLQEGKENAFLSQTLATAQIDLDVPSEETFFLLKPYDEKSLIEFYSEMRFLSLLKEIEQNKKEVDKSISNLITTLIDDEQALQALLNQLLDESSICLDTETTGLNVMQAECVGIGVGVLDKGVWYIPFYGKIGKERILELLLPFFKAAKEKKIHFFGHHLKYDLHILSRLEICLPYIDFDTLLASYLLSPHKPRHNLDLLTLEYFHRIKTPITDLIGKGKEERSMKEVPIEKVANYCGEDVHDTIALKRYFQSKIEKEGLKDVLEKMEIPLIFVLLDMEEKGVYVDVEVLKEIRQELEGELKKIKEDIFSFVGEEFNLNSPKQLGEVLFEKLKIPPQKKTQTGYSTSADVLEELQDHSPVIRMILYYRGLEKLRSTYVEGLLDQIDFKTRRIHCTFSQTGTATGRLACHDPNLQNIPVRSEMGKKIRTAFKPEKKGWSYLSLDYSQIELRLLAHLSSDETLIEAFQRGEDIHSYTASLVYGVGRDEVTPEMRHHAKAVNFGILYGQTPFGLSKELGISLEKAKAFMQAYFEKYQKVESYLQQCIAQVEKTGYAETMWGRKRPIPEIASRNIQLKKMAERLAVNTPLQGSNADIIKLAMIDIVNKIAKNEVRGYLILQVHDELIFEVEDSYIEILSNLAKESMQNVVKLKVPLVVDISIGKNWGEC